MKNGLLGLILSAFLGAAVAGASPLSPAVEETFDTALNRYIEANLERKTLEKAFGAFRAGEDSLMSGATKTSALRVSRELENSLREAALLESTLLAMLEFDRGGNAFGLDGETIPLFERLLKRAAAEPIQATSDLLHTLWFRLTANQYRLPAGRTFSELEAVRAQRIEKAKEIMSLMMKGQPGAAEGAFAGSGSSRAIDRIFPPAKGRRGTWFVRSHAERWGLLGYASRELSGYDTLLFEEFQRQLSGRGSADLTDTELVARTIANVRAEQEKVTALVEKTLKRTVRKEPAKIEASDARLRAILFRMIELAREVPRR